ncbi:MAG: hypothetical protein K2G63_02010 [Oscillospiraceae bacterium]|nr:hypothetical protein [Oscillospiraceae bacterium]
MNRKKSSIIFNILIVLYLIIMIALVFGQFDNFIFGSLIINKNLITSINNIVMGLSLFHVYRNKKKSGFSVFCIILAVACSGMIIWDFAICDKYTIAKEKITLSDNTEIFLSEKKSDSKYIDIYKVNFIFAEKLGRIDEYYYSNDCLADNKYIYQYSEDTKILNIICEYGTYGNEFVRRKEEFDTGFDTFEFVIE